MIPTHETKTFAIHVCRNLFAYLSFSQSVCIRLRYYKLGGIELNFSQNGLQIHVHDVGNIICSQFQPGAKL